MVSICRDFNRSTRGGVFFNDASINEDDRQRSQSAFGEVDRRHFNDASINDDDTQRLQSDFGEVDRRQFVPLDTVVVVVLELLLAIAVIVTSVVLAVVWPEELDRCAPFFLILYIHAAFWCISLVVDFHVKQKHHILRLNGYLEFYQQIHNHSRMPFYIVSFWNTVLLILSTIFHHLYDDFKQQCLATGMKPVYHLCIVIGVEVLILIVVMATYIYKVVVFNRSKPPPDVLREEWMLSFIQDSYSGGEIGYREPGDYVYDLLEKQADLIRYLLDRNSKLSRNIMRITTQLDENNRL